MKRLLITAIFTILFSFLVCTGTMATTITIDGNYTDWFDEVTGFQLVDSLAIETGEIDHGYTDGIEWAEEDYLLAGSFVGPGGIGQTFDHEGLYFTSDDENYYIGLMSGMAPGANSGDYFTGDIAIDTGINSDFDAALRLDGVRNETDIVSVLNGVTGWTDTDPWHPVYNPTPYTVIASSETTEVLSLINQGWAYGDHGESWFYEFSIDKLSLDLTYGATLFVTQSCGNDWLELRVKPISTSVPEPCTLTLLGFGSLFLLISRRTNRHSLFK